MPESCRIYVGNLPYEFRDRDLERIFDKYGPMEECVVRYVSTHVPIPILKNSYMHALLAAASFRHPLANRFG